MSRSTSSISAFLAAALVAGACTTTSDDSSTPTNEAPRTSEPTTRIVLDEPTDTDEVTAPPPTTPTDGSGAVVISEIHYHPADDSAEFVEITNVGDQTVDVGGWCIEGFGFCFEPSVTLAPDTAFVVDDTMTEGRLDNGGELIELTEADGTAVDSVEYDDRLRWPAMADGEGFSLGRRSASASGMTPGNWMAGEPTPGAPSALSDTPFPEWTTIEHTVSPEPGTIVVVAARVDGATSASLEYRIGFDDPKVVDAEPDADGEIEVDLPAPDSGELIRFRLIGETDDGTVGTWPRQGDGSEWIGTVSASDGNTDLPRIQWFMPDDVYAEASADLTLFGDDGYPAVIAIDGVAYSEVSVRVKGGSSRGWPKPKFKFSLPPGHEFDLPGLIDDPVDEFAIHAAWNDKSFAREVLATEAFQRVGLPASDVFPVQVERNGEFFGLYLYVEQPDGTWRDRHGFDDALVYDVGGSIGGAELTAGEAFLPEADFRAKFGKETDGDPDDEELRDFLIQLGTLEGDDLRDWYLRNVDVPAVIDFLAVSTLIQHQDYRFKNHRLIFDDDRWTVTPHDLELTYGRAFESDCQSLCESVNVTGVSTALPTWAPFTDDPVLSEMLARRIETLTQTLLDPERLRVRLDDYSELIADEAARDRAAWGTYDTPQSAPDAIDELWAEFIVPQSERLRGPDAPWSIAALPPAASLSDVSVETSPDTEPMTITVRNESTASVDLSGASLGSCDLTIPQGTVLPAGYSAVLASSAEPIPAESLDAQSFVAGVVDLDGVIDACEPRLGE